MIDVIIPVYNGFQETKECLHSLLYCKNELEHRFILINDKSPDNAIVKMLEAQDDKRIILINNRENLGFVGTVNKGMEISNNDVILLNSDTIVTDHWIDKLYYAAYSHKRVGTVTALTNNGTIASVPYFNRDNIIPNGYDLKTYAKLIEKISYKIYPEIPTAVGHALYIKREILNLVGYFDMDLFSKGYGEEEDFSCRVIKKGYKNILADDTFIFHYGSTSFKDEKALLIAQNKKKLIKKHWWHPFNVKMFLLFNKKVRKVCKNIQRKIKV